MNGEYKTKRHRSTRKDQLTNHLHR
jgi:hypothetical protein